MVIGILLILSTENAWSAGRTAVEVYPGPGVDQYQSDLYRVEVKDGSRWRESYTYKVARRSVIRSFSPPDGGNSSVNFTTFGTSGSVMVRVSKAHGTIHSIEISPKSKSIVATIIEGRAQFQLNPWEKAWVIVDRDEYNPLFIYADPPKPAIPRGAIYFGTGVHDIGLARKVGNGRTVYLDGGAWVIGTFDLTGQSHVTISGPGVLSGEKYSYEDIQGLPLMARAAYSMIRGTGSAGTHDNRLERITIVNSPYYNVMPAFEYIGGVKLLSPWTYSTDGFHLIGHPNTLSILEHCFAFIGDDVIFPRENYEGNLEYRDSFFSATNNSVFQICYWGEPLTYNHTAYIHDIDVKNYLIRDNSAVFKASINGTQQTGVMNMTFENIRIEGDLMCPLILIENRHYFWPNQTKKPETALGNTYNMVFRNVSVFGRQAGPKSTLLGLDDENGHHDYLFDHVSIHGVTLTADNYSDYIRINKYVWNIQFIGAGSSGSARKE